MKGSKICGISDQDTLNFIINHQYPPQFIGFICNYKKSSRYIEVEKLNKILSLDKKKSKFCILTSKYDVIKKFETNKQKDVDINIRISNESSLKKIDPDLNIYIYSI